MACATDFQYDQTMDGRTPKILNVIDKYTPLCPAIRFGRVCRLAELIDTIEELPKLYPPLTHLRIDNGSEFIANALQECCTAGCFSMAYTGPGSPWVSPFLASFNS